MDSVTGLYQHSKTGLLYFAERTATDEASGTLMVVYRGLSGSGQWWLRPYTEFMETVRLNGIEVPRFRRILHPDDIRIDGGS